MRTSRPLALLILLLASAGCGSVSDPREFLPMGTFDVDVIVLVHPPRHAELSARLQAEAERNPEWFREHIGVFQPSTPPPYHPRMGLTLGEYEELIALASQESGQRLGVTKLVVTPTKDGTYVLDGGKDLPELTGITVDPGQNLVRTPFGVASHGSDIRVSAKTVLGAWKGIQWQGETISPDQRVGTRVKFSIGRLAASGRGVLFYSVEQLVDGKMQRRLRILKYELPAKG